jgi:hypothetical protein
MSVDLMKAIFARLTYDAGDNTNPLRTAVSDRIYAIEAPARTTLPLVVYSVDNVNTERFFGGVVKQTAGFTVSVFAKSESGADSIVDTEELVFDLLDQTSVTVTNHDRGYIRNVTRGVPELDGEAFRTDTTFEMIAHLTA